MTYSERLQRENQELSERIWALEAKIGNIRRTRSFEERQEMAAAVQRADEVLAHFGKRAPQPSVAETAVAYRRARLNELKKHSPQFRDTDFRGHDAATLTQIESVVYADAREHARREPQAGVLVPVTTREGGREITRYQGDNMAFLAGCGFYGPGATGVFVRNPNQG